MHSLRLFGGIQVASAPELLEGRAAQRKRLALLGLLAIGPRTISRDRLAGLLWPETDDERARRLLASAVYDLRRALGEDCIIAVGADLRLNPRCVTVDVWEFDDAIRSADWRRAVAVYGGPLLEGLFVSGAVEFDRYVEQERDRYARMWVDALEKCADAHERAAEYHEALPYCYRLVQADPLSARLAMRLMACLAAAGERATAIRYARTYEGVVRREEMGPPDPSVADFAARLSAEAIATPLPRSLVPAPRAVSGGDDPDTNRAQIPQAPASARPMAPPTQRIRPIAATVAVVLLSLAVVAALAARSDVPDLVDAGALPETPAIVVADFVGSPSVGDAGPAVREWLRIDLSQSPHLRALPPRVVAATLGRMQVDAASGVTPDIWLEVARRSGAAGVLSGEVAALGDRYVITAVLTRADGQELLSARQTARNRSDLLDAVSALSRQVRRAMGESRASLRASRPLPQVTTRSIEALLLYGKSHAPGQRVEDLTAQLEQALRYDSTFAMAYRRLASLAENSGRAVTAAYYARKAYEHADRLPEPERSATMATYRDYVLGDRPGAIAIFRAAVERYPRNVFFHSYLADLLLREQRWAEAEAAARVEIALAPNSYSGHSNLMHAQLALGKHQEARRTLAAADSLPISERVFLALHLAEATRDFQAADRWLDSLEVLGETDSFILWSHRLDFALARGRLAEASRIVSQELTDPAERLTAATAVARVRLSLLGDTAAEIAAIEEALRRDPVDSIAVHRRPYVQLAEFFADAGRIARSRSLIAAFQASPAFQPLHSGDAAILRAEGRLEAAANAYDVLNDRSSSAECTYRYAFELGPTRERAGDVRGAIRAYEEGVSAFGCQYRDFSLGMAYVALRRLHGLAGDAESSSRYHGALAALWQGADPELAHILGSGSGGK